jgi:hypothetical protein
MTQPDFVEPQGMELRLQGIGFDRAALAEFVAAAWPQVEVDPDRL